MNRLLPCVLALMFLPACVSRSVSDDLPANDLDALVANVRAETRPTLLPNGKEYCAEDARNDDEQDVCLGDAEDAVFTGNRKLARVYTLVDTAVKRLKLQRDPCNFFERNISARERCAPKIPLQP